MERRNSDRHNVWFPMTIVTDDGKEGTAITFDASSTGVMLACPGQLPEGEHVTLRFRLTGDDEERAIGARVVRVQESPDVDPRWRFRMAVHFDARQPELEGLLQAEHAR